MSNIYQGESLSINLEESNGKFEVCIDTKDSDCYYGYSIGPLTEDQVLDIIVKMMILLHKANPDGRLLATLHEKLRQHDPSL